ncbi:hypothetical protein [Methylococcus sp. EFPC2]|uniref:hypothetical protein n=1 Tax=Methylococcus sp. EFPC2 TaxID=2812648 RepID=UPI001968A0E3|nr:hypothetical protein [Methylococcus sp. EFPC2]QSA97701.1 hypothetical protein JWZ97_02360 [Methylococcus sp. EFPC2]
MPLSKKDIEALYLQRVKGLLVGFPDGVIVQTEEPDFLVQGESLTIGIELTELHREAPAGTVPLQAAEAMRNRVVRRAQELYTVAGLPPIRCTVFIREQHIKKDQVEALATAVAKIAERNLPGSNQSRSESYDWVNRAYFPEVLDTVTVHRLDQITENFFSSPGSTWVIPLAASDIERALSAKNPKYSVYRAKCDQAWLVINADISTMSTWYKFERSVIAGRFKTPFDRVFLLRHFASELHELDLTR